MAVSSPQSVSLNPALAFTQVTAASGSGFALQSIGEVWSWGDNTFGILGDNSITQRTSPVTTAGVHHFQYIAAGKHHLSALKGDGKAWGWGRNNFGQIGDGTFVDKSSPSSVVGGRSFVKIDAGDCHTMAINRNGEIYTWGCDTHGQLGFDLIAGAIGAARGTSWAIDSDGVLWGWGDNFQGTIGDGTITPRTSPVTVISTGPWASNTQPPEPIQSIPGVGLALFPDPCDIPGNCFGIAHAHENTSFGYKADGSLWAWGAGVNGELGTGSFNVSTSSPVSVLGTDNWFFWTGGQGHAAAMHLSQDYEVWMWGNPGSMGIGGGATSYNSPVNIETFPANAANPFINYPKKKVTHGNLSAMALDTFGNVWAWGSDIDGKLAINASGSRNTPTSCYSIPGIGGYIDVGMGDRNSIFLDSSGNVYLAGSGDFGRNAMVGGNPVGNSIPTSILGGPHSAIAVRIPENRGTFGFLRADGSLWMWGYNGQGQLGGGFRCFNGAPAPCDGGTPSKCTSPISVLGSGDLYNFVNFWMGQSHTIAIDDTGQVWAWGDHPAVGTGAPGSPWSPLMVLLPTITPEKGRNSPTRVGRERWTDIAAGNRHSVALDLEGKVWSWGKGTEGQIGNDAIESVGIPTSADGGQSFIDIAAGINYSYALNAFGEVWSWGENTCGKLGDDTTNPKSTPTIIPPPWDRGCTFDCPDEGVPPGGGVCCYSQWFGCPTLTGTATVNPGTEWIGSIDPACTVAGYLSCAVISNSGCTGLSCSLDFTGDKVRVQVPANACGSFTVQLIVTQQGVCQLDCDVRFDVRINNTGQGGEWTDCDSAGNSGLFCTGPWCLGSRYIGNKGGESGGDAGKILLGVTCWGGGMCVRDRFYTLDDCSATPVITIDCLAECCDGCCPGGDLNCSPCSRSWAYCGGSTKEWDCPSCP